MTDERVTQLFSAAFEGDGKAVAGLLELGVSPAARDEDGSTVLYQAVGSAWVVGVLLAAGAPPDEVSGGEGEGTPLCRAACFGLRDSLNTLLRGGADPNVAESDGYTPLLWAAANGWYECVGDLLEAGADPNAAGLGGSTPLHYAAERGSLQVTRLLLEYGASASVRDDLGRTPLARAEAWIGKDVETELRRAVMEHAPPGSVAETRRTIVVEAKWPDRRGVLREIECGHSELAKLLQGEH